MEKQSLETRQILMLGILSAVLSFVFSGLEVLYTLYAINTLHISASEWSQIRGYRYILTALIVLVLGTYAGKFGQKRIAAVTVALGVLNLLLFVVHPSKLLLFITLPFHAALISMVTMSINVLVQEVPNRLQAVSNTVYRSTYTGFAIFGPLTLALFAGSNPMPWFVLFIVCLLICLPGFLAYPSLRKNKDAADKSHSIREVMSEWRLLVKNKRFIYFEVWVITIYSAFLVNMIFGPIKLIQTLALNEQQFSYTSTGVAIVTMAFTLVMGFLLKRLLVYLIYFPLFFLSLGNILFGMQSDVMISIVLFIVTNALNLLSFASVSIWTSRIVTKEQVGIAFTFHKVFIAVFGFVFSILLSYLQIHVGIDICMIIMGIVGCVCSLLLRRELRAQTKHYSSNQRMAG